MDEESWTGDAKDILETWKRYENELVENEKAFSTEWISRNVNLEKLAYWLGLPEKTVAFGNEPQELLVTMTNCVSPMDFHLMWKNSDQYLSKILREWMTVKIGHNSPMFPITKGLEDLKPGTFLSCFHLRDGSWYRAVMLGRSKETRCTVQLIDSGMKLDVGFERLRILPKELHPPRSRPLTFRCQIAKLDSYSASVQVKTIPYFVRATDGVEAFKVAVNKVNNLNRLRQVSLWSLDNDALINTTILKTAQKFSEYGTSELDIAAKPLEKDMAIMLHMNCEVENSDLKIIRTKGLRNFRVTRVVSPYEFYMEYVYEISENKDTSMVSRMQEFYNDPLSRDIYRLRTCRVYRRRHYVWFHEQAQSWERVRVLELQIVNRTADVYLVDMGRQVTVDIDELYELKPDFYSFSAKAFRAQLADVTPVNGGSEWSEESISAFKGIVEDPKKIFHGVVVYRNIVQNTIGGNPTGQETMDLLVILVEKNSETKFTVQAKLVDLGHAKSTGVSSSRLDVFENLVSTELTQFSFTDWEKHYKECGFPEENPKQDSMDESEMIRGNSLLEPNPVQGDGSDTLEVYQVAETDKDKAAKNWQLPTQILSRLPVVKLINILNPGCIYVHPVCQQEELSSFVDALSKEVRASCKEIKPDDIKVGNFVAIMNKVQQFGERTWHRACIRQVLAHLKLVKVVLIDFGLDVLCSYSLVRALPDFFQNVPGFAYRIHMDVENFMPAGTVNWSQAASSNFPRYMRAWEKVEPSYFVWRWSGSSMLMAAAIHQPVIYSRRHNVWKLAHMLDVDLLNPLSTPNHQLLHNLLCSHGSALEYEVNKHSECFKFESVADILVKMNLAVYAKSNVEVDS